MEILGMMIIKELQALSPPFCLVCLMRGWLLRLVFGKGGGYDGWHHMIDTLRYVLIYYVLRVPHDYARSIKHSLLSMDKFENHELFRLFKIRSPQPPSICRNYHGYILNTCNTRLANIRISSSPQPDSHRCFQIWNRVPNPPGPFALPFPPSELTCRGPFASSDRGVCFRRIPNSDRGVNPNTDSGAKRVIIMNQTAFRCFDVNLAKLSGIDRNRRGSEVDWKGSASKATALDISVARTGALILSYSSIPRPFQQLWTGIASWAKITALDFDDLK